MNDAARLNAIAKRDAALEQIVQCEERIKALRAEVSRAEDFLRLWTEFAVDSGENVDNGETVQNAPESHGDGTPRPRPKNPKKEDVAEAAREAIRERGKPIQRDELFHLLTERGWNIQGRDPEMVFSTMLWRMQDRVVRIPKFGYWLPEEPFPEANYDPNVPHPGDEESAEMVRKDINGTLPDDIFE